MRGWAGLFAIVSLVFSLHILSEGANAHAAPAAAQSSGAASASSDAPALDYDFFKTRVEPIFLKKRPTHARCYVCHEGASHALNLAKLDAGNANWTEEESRRNFDTVSQLVNPGDPLGSTLLRHPLAPEAGGDAFHSGGRQFGSQTDPDWKTLADWVRGQKAK
ncbi:MAG: hypothetical protein LAO19_02020 [Acidobacteriia bacterium]|nr:hypothetical protein [Terriglobia bacterium]